MKPVEIQVVDTTDQVRDLVNWLISYHAAPKQDQMAIYIDLKGINLCREGSISLLALLVDTAAPTMSVYLIDIKTLGSQAFDTVGAYEKTLRHILENPCVPKVFFDVRNDSDALFAHFGITLRDVEDVQLMENAARSAVTSRKYLIGLTKCVEDYLRRDSDLGNWKLAKQNGQQSIKTELGGSYAVLDQRPIPEQIVAYCAGDVQCLPALRAKLRSKNEECEYLVNTQAAKRVAASHEPQYQPHGPDRMLAPWSSVENRLLNIWNPVRPVPNRFDEGDLEEDSDDSNWDDSEEFWEDDYPTSGRDIINAEDYHLYYSD